MGEFVLNFPSPKADLLHPFDSDTPLEVNLKFAIFGLENRFLHLNASAIDNGPN